MSNKYTEEELNDIEEYLTELQRFAMSDDEADTEIFNKMLEEFYERTGQTPEDLLEKFKGKSEDKAEEPDLSVTKTEVTTKEAGEKPKTTSKFKVDGSLMDDCIIGR